MTSSRIIELIILAPSPIFACAPIVTFGPIFASEWIYAVGWIQTRPYIYFSDIDFGCVRIDLSISL